MDPTQNSMSDEELQQMMDLYGMGGSNSPNSSQIPDASNNFNSSMGDGSNMLVNMQGQNNNIDPSQMAQNQADNQTGPGAPQQNKNSMAQMSALKQLMSSSAPKSTTPTQPVNLLSAPPTMPQQVQIPSNRSTMGGQSDILKQLEALQKTGPSQSPQGYAYGGTVEPKFNKLKSKMKK